MSTPLLDLLLILFARSNVYFDDLIATRLLLEPQTAALAAQHASATQRREVQSLARSFNDIVGDLGETVNTRQAELLTSRDSRLHYAIAEASNNPVLPILTEVLIGLSWRQSLSYKVFPSGDQFRTASHQHLAIANAIVQRDSAAAEKAMIEHLEFTRLTFKDVPEDLTQLTTNSLAS